MSSGQSGEGEIRKNLIEADLVDCMVALPGQLFYSTQIPACLWFLARDRKDGKFRDRRGEILFIDARKLGRMVDRTHRELTDEDVTRIADTYHLWRSDPHPGPLPVGEGVKRGRPHPGPLPQGEGKRQYRGGFDFSGLAQTAKELRKKQTAAEAVMWEFLRNRRFMNLKFRRQHQVGEYVVDFYCDEYNLAIELDGPVHDEAKQSKKDKTRDAYLQSLGLTVLRLRNENFLADPEAAFSRIAQSLPSPAGSGAGSGERLAEESLPSPVGRGAGGEGVAVYRDIPGFCKSATLEEVRKHGHVLTPGRYVGAEAQEEDEEPFEDKMKRLTAQLREQQTEAAKLDAAIADNLKALGFPIGGKDA